jgi:hypothetical protein
MGCASSQPWHGFLDSEVPTWQQYLDEPISVAITNVPLGELIGRYPFQNLNAAILFRDAAATAAVDPFVVEPLEPRQYVVNTTADHTTRRELLWRIAQEYALSMEIRRVGGTARFVEIKPRETGAEPVAPTYPMGPHEAAPSVR